MSAFVESGDGEFVIQGDLSREQVPGLWQQRTLLWQSTAPTLSLSLREVSQADTAGLALLVLLQAEAKQRGTELLLLDMPAQLQAAAAISHLDPVLGQAS